MICTRVLIAGVAGASLGTEILKCLSLAGKYKIYGCDISRYAYGLYEEGFDDTFLIDRDNYLESIIEVCKSNKIKYLIPGAEQPMIILGENKRRLKEEGITLVGNTEEIISVFSDKGATFRRLSELGIDIPYTKIINDVDDLIDMKYPCVIKPSTGSGGSSFVFFVSNVQEAKIYAKYLMDNSKIVLAQEYIAESEGEFTVGVLNLPGKRLVDSIALKRLFPSKLSITSQLKDGLISSGYSQGLIDEFKDIRATCERIAKLIGSEGPINIQGRLKNGKFIPFEINPRFSASTYLRALAGFNEIDIYLQFLINKKIDFVHEIKYGYYFRSFTEKYISKEEINSDKMD